MLVNMCRQGASGTDRPHHALPTPAGHAVGSTDLSNLCGTGADAGEGSEGGPVPQVRCKLCTDMQSSNHSYCRGVHWWRRVHLHHVGVSNTQSGNGATLMMKARLRTGSATRAEADVRRQRRLQFVMPCPLLSLSTILAADPAADAMRSTVLPSVLGCAVVSRQLMHMLTQ